MDQNTANFLMALEKKIVEVDIIFPSNNTMLSINAISLDDNERFLIDINRKGLIKLSRCSFQERFCTTEGLVRLDLDESKTHRNPDDQIIAGPHLHVYREGYGLRWAYALKDLSPCPFKVQSDLVSIFIEFCNYCNITTTPIIQGGWQLC